MMKYLVLGNRGQLGIEVSKRLEERGCVYSGFDKDEVDIRDIPKITTLLQNFKPNVIINCAAFNGVDSAEINSSEAFKVNSDAPAKIAAVAADIGAKFIHFSTDYVFNGKNISPYLEGDTPDPVNKYGDSKLFGEFGIISNTDDYLIFRSSWLYGEGNQNFIYKFLKMIENKDSIDIPTNEISVPTSTKLVTAITLEAINMDLKGVYHVTNSSFTTRFEYAKFIAEVLKLNIKINPININSLELKAKRPVFSVMSNGLISKALDIDIPLWKEEVREYLVKM